MRLIDADAASDYLKICLDKARRDDIKAIPIILGMMQFIGNFPTGEADPVRHGRWIDNKHTDTAICSECSRVFIDETPYCPNCGAEMNEGGDGK